MAYYDYERFLLNQLDNIRMQLSARPLTLGGVSSTGGGSGGPVGGFIGYLPQTRVTYDLSELASSGITGSGTLLDNLNHIRYRIQQLEDVGITITSPQEDQVIVYNGTDWVNQTFSIPSGVVPSTSSGTGFPGQVAWNTSHLYLCVATDTWKRITLDTW